ncbi:MAG: SAM-dependent DNA methyltransferase, partial [Terriglobia bacterium]
PKTWGYLHRFETVLRKTGIFKRFFKPTDPFYSIFNVGDYTFAPFKLVIREIAGTLTCAVLGKKDRRVLIPDHKLVLVPSETAHEAHYLCAVLNSSPARCFAASYTIETQFSTHIFQLMSIPTFSEKNPVQLRLAELSEAAHKITASGDMTKVKSIEDEVNRVAAKLWDLTDAELSEIRASLEK